MNDALDSYRDFLDVIPDAALIVDGAGTIVLANSQACLLFGYLPDELHRQSVQVLIPETLRARHVRHVEAFAAAPRTRPMGDGRNLAARHKDGREFPADIMLKPVDIDGVPLTIGVVRDASERVRIESALRRSEEQYRHLVDNASEVFYRVAIDDDPLKGIEGWSRALDLRDKETEGHTLRVTAMTLRPGGKHPTHAYELLSPIAYLQPALEIPYCHHERWDGIGYPRGLSGEQIPLAARLFAVVDAWDALRSDRPYRPGWSEARVRDHLEAHAGTHFDPSAVALFFQTMSA